MPKLDTLQAWTHGKHVARTSYRATMEKPLASHYALADQIRRAANSVPANIVEGYALGTRPQLVRCLRIAFASACELSCVLEMANDLDLLPPGKAKSLAQDCNRLIGLLVGLIKKLQK